jgi:hypothetical protein
MDVQFTAATCGDYKADRCRAAVQSAGSMVKESRGDDRPIWNIWWRQPQ